MAHMNSFNTVDSYNNVWNNCTITEGRSQLFTWLSPLEPSLRHQEIRERRVGNVGGWLLETKEFRSWHAGSGGGESDEAVLFCYGNPGVGKTYICSLVIDRLCDQAEEENVAVACFYFDFAAQKEQSPTKTLGTLLKQVVSGLEEVPGGIAKAYENQKKAIGGRVPQLSDIVNMLQTISSEKRTFICIDAMDECVAESRVKILDSLRQILQSSPGTRIFVTGRPHIQDEIERRISRRVTTIRITPKRGDIIGYLRAKLSEDTNPDAMDSSLETDILKKIPEDVSEIFLLVSLNIDAILQETTIYHRRQKLKEIVGGLGLGDAYGATLDRIKEQGGRKARLGIATLMWISHAERPLKADELRHALAVEIGSPDFNSDNIPSIGTLLNCCQGLVVVDKRVSTVRLIHFTLQEYLQARPELFGTAHSTIAETCLSYLDSQKIRALPASRFPHLQSTPFLEYSSLYWGSHAKRNLSDCAKQLALKLFDDCSSHISTQILLREPSLYFYYGGFDKPGFFSGLHWASMFGIDEIVTGLIEVEGCDINRKDYIGNTPLVWAAWNGHEGVVKILLGRDDINPEKPTKGGRTPLCCAAFNGHEGVVKTLLERGGVNPDKPNEGGRTPLWCAALNGHEGVVKTLLARDDVNPAKSDEDGRTPLWCAALNGHPGVVRILLRRDDASPAKRRRLG